MLIDKTYTINSSRAISETLEGETIIIDLENGAYYSMNQTGSMVWDYLKEGNSVAQIAKYFMDSFEGDPGVIEKGILDLLKILEENSLILENSKVSVVPLKSQVDNKKSFVIPTIEKYEDMQEMLLADPIHDVDVTGWPKLKKVN